LKSSFQAFNDFRQHVIRKMVQELRHGIDSNLASRTAGNTNTATAASYTSLVLFGKDNKVLWSAP
jgi:hypothetical protein